MRRRTRIAATAGVAVVMVAGISGAATASSSSSPAKAKTGTVQCPVAKKVGPGKDGNKVKKIALEKLKGKVPPPGAHVVKVSPNTAHVLPRGVKVHCKGPGGTRFETSAPIAAVAKQLGVPTSKVEQAIDAIKREAQGGKRFSPFEPAAVQVFASALGISRGQALSALHQIFTVAGH